MVTHPSYLCEGLTDRIGNLRNTDAERFGNFAVPHAFRPEMEALTLLIRQRGQCGAKTFHVFEMQNPFLGSIARIARLSGLRTVFNGRNITAVPASAPVADQVLGHA